jgi:RHS repeat-associated protein
MCLKKLDDITGLIDLNSNPPLTYDTGGTEGRSTAVALLTETTSSLYELGPTPIVSKSQMEYNNLGRVTKYIHQGDINNPGDDYTSDIIYHSSTVLQDNNLIGIPSEISVFDNNSQLVRKRQTLILDETKGTIGTIKAYYTTSDPADTQMTYDQYGNLASVTLPPNDNTQSMSYQYTYDTTENKYVTQVQDAYGYISSSTYDYWFDSLLTSTDITGNIMIREYDDFGRLAAITGPNETAQSLPYTIKMEYYPRYANLSGVVSIDQADFMPVAVTSHYDPQHPGNDIQTYTFMDGLGRAVQVKKDIEMDMGDGTTQERMSVSGKVSYDLYGRGVSQYHPWHEAKQLPDNFVINEYGLLDAAHTEYDVLDRVTKTINPLGNESITEYSLDVDFFSNPALKVKSVTDQGGSLVETEVFKDINGRVTSTKNVLTGSNPADIWTSFAYSSIGELQSYTDNEGLVTSYQYDLLGRKTQLVHPDNGTTNYTYDTAGNLTSVQTANLEADTNIPVQDRFIKYFYEYNRVTDIVFPDTAGNSNIANVRYTYGSSGNETGRVTEQTDATGTQRFAYGNMGEIVHNRRTVVGPNIPTMTFDTQFTYDSWNRIQSIRYPDGEEVFYTYDLGGNLRIVEGTYMEQPYPYVKNIYYDHYEQRTYLQYGNGTETFYQYSPELRRLSNLQVTTSSQEDLLLNDYAYDNVGNILTIKNNAQPNSVNKMGGYYVHDYKYDNLNRLTDASGVFEGDPSLGEIGGDYNSAYHTKLEYNTTHGIILKNQGHEKNNGQQVIANSYDNWYTYYEGTHKVKHINDPGTGITENFNYDLNGNITKRYDTNGNVRGLIWDEVNRLRVVDDSQDMQHYIYDASGERILKAGSAIESVYENGTLVNSNVTFNTYTTYPSAFIVVNAAEYSKHYYAGSQRVVSRIGDQNTEIFVDQEGFAGRPAASENSGTNESQGFDAEKLRQLQISDLTAIMKKAKRGVPAFKKYEPKAEQEQDDENLQQKSNPQQTTMMAPPQGLIYFYHPDHLGTSTFLTDVNGEAYQFFLNLPFGETMAEQHSQTEDWETPYKFNGKELDPETGYYYYGARYYDPRTSIWLSTDPLAEKFPNVNSYVYCLQNPVKLVDPDGLAPEHIVDGQGNRLDIKIVNNQIVYGTNVSQDVKTILNAMWETEMGQSKVQHLLNTRSDVYLDHNDNIGVMYTDKYRLVGAVTGPTKNQDTELIEDYDGTMVYKENTIIFFMGTYQYGLDYVHGEDNSGLLAGGNITVIDGYGKDITKKHAPGLQSGKKKVEPSMYPEKILKSLLWFFNVNGVHETTHVTGENIAIKDNDEREDPAYRDEDKTIEQLKEKNIKNEP